MVNGLLLGLWSLVGPLGVQHVVPQEPPRMLRLCGRVLDVTGTPIVDAGVAFGSLEQVSTAEALAHPRARTGADGVSAITVERDLGFWGVPQVLVIAAPGKVALWCPSLAQFDNTGAASREDRVDLGDIRLPQGVTLRGRVRGPGGKPVAGARVRALDCLSTYQWLPTFGGQAITGEDGRFTLPGVFGTAMAITVEADGHYTTSLPAVNLGDPLDLVLEESGFVAGTVLDAEGKPWQGTAMVIYECVGTWTPVKTTAEGTFRFSVPLPCRFRVTARDVAGRTADSRILDGPASGVEVRFGVAGEKWFGVRAVDAETGDAVRPIRAAAYWFEETLTDNVEEMLEWEARESLPDGKAWLDPPGLGGFPGDGKGVVSVVAEGYAPLYVEKVEWKEDEEFVAKLAREAIVEGKVVDAATGKPMSGVEVTCVRVGKKARRPGAPPSRKVPTLTAQDGSFTIRGLAGGGHEITARRPDGTTLLSRRVQSKPGQTRKDLQFDLPAGVTVSGKVVGVKPAPGWLVLLAPKDDEAAQVPFDIGGSVFEAWNCKGAAPLAADGSFRFEHRAPGTEHLWLVLPTPPRQGSALRIPVQTVRIGKDDLDLAVDVAAQLPGTITGKLSVAGAAVPSGRLAVITIPVVDDSDRQPHAERIRCRHWTLADDGGVFAIPAATGNYRLEVVDIATGVMLGKSQENGDVRSGKATAMDLRIEVVEMTVELETGLARHGADRLQIQDASDRRPDITLFGGGQHGSPGVDLRGVERRVCCYVPAGAGQLVVTAATMLARGSVHWAGEEQTERFEAESGKPAKVTIQLRPPSNLDGK
ncbi:MAG: carboxypeptidase regulatory-like domain-containing protein [Planctomycetota bacterium]|nr:carboxypeptidase regulatory-like domain-containing protein [Planctomycetota bacterium]